jgi:hypothetical protein
MNDVSGALLLSVYSHEKDDVTYLVGVLLSTLICALLLDFFLDIGYVRSDRL